MKVIYRNCTTEYQNAAMTSIEKDDTSVNFVKIADFSSIRGVKGIKIRFTLKNLGDWSNEKITFSLAKGTKDTSNIAMFIGKRVEVEAKKNTVAAITQTFVFSDTSNYPDTDALKFAVVTSDYTTSQNAKTVTYKLEYAFLE